MTNEPNEANEAKRDPAAGEAGGWVDVLIIVHLPVYGHRGYWPRQLRSIERWDAVPEPGAPTDLIDALPPLKVSRVYYQDEEAQTRPVVVFDAPFVARAMRDPTDAVELAEMVEQLRASDFSEISVWDADRFAEY